MKIRFKYQGTPYEADVEYLPTVPGRFNAAPEDCYPDEGHEIDYVCSLSSEGEDMIHMLEDEGLMQAMLDACEAAYEEEHRMSPPPGYDD